MTDVRHSGSAPHRAPAHLRSEAPDVTLWLGWVLFIGIVLIAAGVINAIQGLVALLDDDFYRTSAADLAINVNYTAWGWALLILGAALVVAGGGIALGYAWARVFGVVVCAINTLTNLGFAGAYPFWTVIAVSVNVLAIYALIVHGGEGRALRTGRG
jgi:hypothetical protein